MFEVGKKYKNKRSGMIAECVWSDPMEAVVKHGYAVVLPHYEEFNWTKYVEPKVEKIRRNVCKEDNEFYSYRYSGYSYYGTIELTITDGKLTNVEIVE